jgi:hypothetical protein
MTPSPDIRVCLDCGWSEFVIPRAWLSAGWLRSQRPQSAASDTKTETRNDTRTGARVAPQIATTAFV